MLDGLRDELVAVGMTNASQQGIEPTTAPRTQFPAKPAAMSPRPYAAGIQARFGDGFGARLASA